LRHFEQDFLLPSDVGTKRLAEPVDNIAAQLAIRRVAHRGNESRHAQVIADGPNDQFVVLRHVAHKAGQEALLLDSKVGQKAGMPERQQVRVQARQRHLVSAGHFPPNAQRQHEPVVVIPGEKNELGMTFHGQRLNVQLSTGAEGQSRTADTLIFSQVLYHLSYLGTLGGAAQF
jgi:hypothetical protein